MPREHRHVEALLLKRVVSGEQHQRLTCLSAEYGSIVCMKRQSRSLKRSGTQPDLFDFAALELSKANQGDMWFVDDYRVLRRFDGIGQDYRAFEHACEFARILELNHTHASDNQDLINLALQTLEAWEKRIRPEATLLKALYLLAKQEGYAVHSHWLLRLNAQDQAHANEVLRQPLDKIQTPSAHINRITELLRLWLSSETDIYLEHI